MGTDLVRYHVYILLYRMGDDCVKYHDFTYCMYISLLQDGDFAELPPDVLERLLRRPEDLEEQAVGNIAKYKNKMLRLLEVCVFFLSGYLLMWVCNEQCIHIGFLNLSHFF